MKGIDSKSFEPFVNYTHVKDKNGIYSFYPKENEIVIEKVEISPEIDLKTLQPIENYSEYSKDKNNVYYNVKKIENFKPNNFEVIDYSLVKQNEDLYYFTEDENDNTKFVLLESKNVDIDTFQILDDDYAKDKNNTYYKGKIFKEADSKTLDKYYNENDNGYKIRDKKKVYKIKELD